MNRKNIETNPLLKTYKKYIEKIDTALNNELELYLESEFTEPLKYAVDGGRRIRPIILLLASECVGKVDENTLSGACAIELLHTESVIHDDIIDNETKRRQKDPFHIKFGYNTSVLTGDFVLGLILNISNYNTLVHLATKKRKDKQKKRKKLKLIVSDDAAADAYDTSSD